MPIYQKFRYGCESLLQWILQFYLLSRSWRVLIQIINLFCSTACLEKLKKKKKKITAKKISLFVLYQKQKIMLIHFKSTFTLHIIEKPLVFDIFRWLERVAWDEQHCLQRILLLWEEGYLFSFSFFFLFLRLLFFKIALGMRFPKWVDRR